MKPKSFFRGLVLSAFALLAAPSRADTVAWWHFDEEAPGTEATSGVVADSVSGKTATALSLAGTVGTETGDYLPAFAKPFHGLAVYDPVTDVTRTNRSAMKFSIAANGDGNANRAYYGGALKVEDVSVLFAPCKDAFTVECFVCTTGGVVNTFAPVFGCVKGTGFTGEKWALYMEIDGYSKGGLALRLTTSSGATVRYQGDATSATVADGAWHHVAYVYDGTAATPSVTLYVDYAAAKSFTGSNIKNGVAYSSDCNLWVGGYPFDNGSGGRKFPGLVDELRVSDAALGPESFLRMRPVDEIEGEVLRVSCDPGPFGAPKDGANMADALGPDRQKVLFKTTGGEAEFDEAVVPGATMGAGLFADAFANAASLSLSTNGTGTSGCHLQVQSFTKTLLALAGGENPSYTVECFFKTRGRVASSGWSGRQAVFKFGTNPVFAQASLCNNATKRDFIFVYTNALAGTHYDASAAGGYDDGQWHHLAMVFDGGAQQARTYVDGVVAAFQADCVSGLVGNNSMFFGSAYSGSFFDGWLDGIRVTARALAPEEFLCAAPYGKIPDGAQPLLLAEFNDSFDLASAENAAFTLAGTAAARAGGAAPALVPSAFGAVLLDATNGTGRSTSRNDASFAAGRVAWGPSRLFSLDATTVEFWARFTGFRDNDGDVGGSAKLSAHAGVLRCVQGDTGVFDWYLYRMSGNEQALQLAWRTWKYDAGAIEMSVSYHAFALDRVVADGKWHHYALSFAPGATPDKTVVTLCDDGFPVENPAEIAAPYVSSIAGRRLLFGESSGDYPSVLGTVNSLRVWRGVPDPSRFLGRDRTSVFVLVVR